MTQRSVSSTWVNAGATFGALVAAGFDLFLLPLTFPTLAQEFGLTHVALGGLMAATLVGMGLGGILTVRLCDRLGRVRASAVSLLMFSLGTGLGALTSSYWLLATLRLLSGFGIGGIYCIGNLLASETVPTRIRTTALALLQSGWSLGYVLAAVFSAWIVPAHGWRPLHGCSVVFGILAILLGFLVEERPSWAAKVAAERPRWRDKYIEIWRNRSLSWTFMIWTFTSVALQFAYYGAISWLPSYLATELRFDAREVGLYVAAASAAMIVGKAATGFLADVLGRGLMWLVVGVGTSLALPLLVYSGASDSLLYMLLVVGLFCAAPYAINSTHLNESFPTSVRGTAVATSYSLGSLSATASPLLVGWAATQHSVGLGIALLGIPYAVSAMLAGLGIREKMYDPHARARDMRLVTPARPSSPDDEGNP